MLHEKLSGEIIGAAMAVLNELGPGLDEKLYERALVIELRRRGNKVDQQKSFPVHYAGELIGTMVPDMIIDDIESTTELIRFKKITDLATQARKKVILISTRNFEYTSKSKTVFKHRWKGAHLPVALFLLIRFILMIPFVITASILSNCNFFAPFNSWVRQWSYYESLFTNFQTQTCLQERHYQTSVIKNFLLKKYGGRLSATLQKNIFQYGRSGLYWDIDIVFSLGESTAEHVREFGGRVDRIIPVGSMFMESGWFIDQPPTPSKIYDVVFIGINASGGKYYLDSYDGWENDYYTCFEWLKKFAEAYPNLQIGIKHHSNNFEDLIEMKILSGVKNLHRIPQKESSYAHVLNAKLVLSYCSTMINEAISESVPSYYLDPGGRTMLLPPLNKNKVIDLTKD